MRIDRWVRNNIGNIPQGLIEKNLRNGKIKVNGKSIEILFKASPGLVLDLESYATDDVLLFEKILKNNYS